MKKITAIQAKKICDNLGLCFPEDDGKTFFATNEEQTEIYDFSNKKERDKFVEKYNK